MKRITLLTLAVIALVSTSKSQTVSVPFDSEKWNTENADFTLTRYRGKDAILFDQGRMFLDEKFLNGTVEFDIHFSSQRNFPGIDFRVREGKSERFYIRPHQSGNPDANQYTPIFNGVAGWQLYHGEKYASTMMYDFRVWHHVKIEVTGSTAKVFIDDMERPELEIEELLTGVEAGGFSLGTGSAVYMSGFQYTKSNQTYPDAEVAVEYDDTYISNWKVSELLPDSMLLDQYTLDKNFSSDREWQDAMIETSGIVNLARFHQRSRGQSTIAVKTTINASKSMIKPLQFGFSDRVTVYVNGKAVFTGDDGFVSRDYRFLGTIGFFDTVYLPLKKGDNEVLFIVTERFGGWGLKAKFENTEDITY